MPLQQAFPTNDLQPKPGSIGKQLNLFAV